jgi:hypothetical protein
MAKKNKVKSIEDPSLATIYLKNFYKNYQSGKLDDQGLEKAVLSLFEKFPMEEVIPSLPPSLVAYLRDYAAKAKLFEDEQEMLDGTFAPEMEMILWIRWRFKMPTMNLRWYLQGYFKLLDKKHKLIKV